MKFSFIVPCYNTSAYLEDCLESIIRQKYEDWEMILVNDGSTDNTEDIMRSYAGKKPQIRVICQDNQGVSVARNRAIQEAKGEYLIFLDSDDWYKDEDSLGQIARTLENGNIDITVFRYQIVRDKKDTNYVNDDLQYFERMRGNTYTGTEYLQIVLSENNVYPWYSWLYAFKRDLWTKDQIQFNEELWILEDMDIIYKVILKAKKVAVLDSPIYQYRVRDGSATKLISKEMMKAEIDVCINNMNIVYGMNINDYLRKLLMSNLSYVYFTILTEVYYLRRDNRKEIFQLLYRNRKMMSYSMRKKNIFIRRLTYILGLHITSRLLFIRLKCMNVRK